jgi:hypothetical protein
MMKKLLTKNPMSIYDFKKLLRKLEMERNFLKLIKNMYQTIINQIAANIIVNGEKLDSFSLK